MHLSKKTLYWGIILYSAALALTMDLPMEMTTTGLRDSGPWLLKLLVDGLFIGMAFVRLAGPSLFADEDSDDEVAIHEEDLHFSDSMLFGLFLLDLAGNGVYHGYASLMSDGVSNIWNVSWLIAELIGLFLCWTLWTHAVKAQRSKARKAASSGSASPTPRPFRGDRTAA